MLLDELAQFWGHEGGLPGLRIGMSVEEAAASLPTRLRVSKIGGTLHFLVGDPLRDEGPVALSGSVKRWREVRLEARRQSDLDESFWSAVSLVVEYLAGALGAPPPPVTIGSRGQEQIEWSCRGVADGVAVEVRLFADAQTEDGLSFELSLSPVRAWSDSIGDALGVGPAFTELVADTAHQKLQRGSPRSLPTDLAGSQLEVLRAEDGSLRVRVSSGHASGTSEPLATSMLTDVAALLRGKCATHEDVEGLGFHCVVYRGLEGPERPLEVRLSRRPTPHIEGELVIC